MFEPFKWSVLALAQPADIQLRLYPDMVCKADELALDWDYALEYLKSHQYPFTADQQAIIDALDALMDDMGGAENWLMWEDDALRTLPQWDRIRTMASQLAHLFAWPLAPPPAAVGRAQPQ